VNRFELQMYKSADKRTGKLGFSVVKDVFKAVRDIPSFAQVEAARMRIARSAATNPIL